jgi:hypothetical protein
MSRKAKVVEDVAGGNEVAEFDGVEENGLAVDQHDIAEMKVAVDAADETAPAALAQQRHDALVRRAACARQRLDLGGRKDTRMLAKGLDVFVDIGAERRDPGLCFDPGRFGVGRRDSAAERVRQHLVDLAAEMVKRPRFVETPHLHRPFDRGP